MMAEDAGVVDLDKGKFIQAALYGVTEYLLPGYELMWPETSAYWIGKWPEFKFAVKSKYDPGKRSSPREIKAVPISKVALSAVTWEIRVTPAKPGEQVKTGPWNSSGPADPATDNYGNALTTAKQLMASYVNDEILKLG